MSNYNYDDKQEEKMHEKELEKQEEKSYEEKNFDEKYRRDPLGSIIWALILIWGGVVLLANNLGYLKQLSIRFTNLPSEIPFETNTWTIFFLGASVILLVEVLIRFLMPEYRRPLLGKLILALVFIAIAVGSWHLIWPVILIVLGGSILLRGFIKRK